MNLSELIERKRHAYGNAGFRPTFIPDAAFDFQRALIEWAVEKGLAALFADCGLGKSLMELAFAQNVVERTNKPVLLLTPLAVGAQMVNEAAKFGIQAARSGDGKIPTGHKIIVTNYEKIHKFNPCDFIGVVCDESGILKNHSGSTRNAVIGFLRTIPYRLLCSATPAPNDTTELGNSVEALGVMRRVEMLARYFVHDSADTGKWRLKGHALDAFWSFVSSWARAIRHPRDIGFNQPGYDLPPLRFANHILPSAARGGWMFPVEARSLNEQRNERRSTLQARCEAVAELASFQDGPFVAWCSLNEESSTLAKMIPGAVELTGSDSDEEKEEKIIAFSSGQIQDLVTKPRICSHGVNWQICHRSSYFPSHSHEEFYQSIRRFWRFGQTSPVSIHIVTTEAESAVLANMQRKEQDAQKMYAEIVANMASHYEGPQEKYNPTTKFLPPPWNR